MPHAGRWAAWRTWREAAELFERIWIEGDDLEEGADPYYKPSKVNTPPRS